MKWQTLILVSLLSAWLGTGCQLTERHQLHYPDGTLKKEWFSYPLESGQRLYHGPFRTWYKDGAQESRVEFKRGQRHGTERNWYKNGNLSSQKNYHKGLLLEEQYWSPSGEEWSHKQYSLRETFHSTPEHKKHIRTRYTVDTTNSHPQKHGKYLSWYPNGKLKTLGKYSGGEPHGFFHEWYKDGTRYSSGKYHFGKKEGTWNYWNPDGSLAQSVPYQKHHKSGILTTYYPTGKVESKQQVLSSQLHGLQKHWYEDGKARSEIRWFRGEKHGLSRSWYPSGTLKSKIPYRHDKVHGKLQTFYPNGKSLVKADYKEGKKHGTYKWWASEGTLINQMEYAGGKKTFDGASKNIQSVFRTEEMTIPPSFLNFYWGMSPPAVQANLFLLRGKIIHRTNEFLHASIPVSEKHPNRPTSLRLHFTPDGKLWEIEAHYSPSTAGNFSDVVQTVEEELGTELGLIQVTQSENKLPAVLSKSREWGSYLLQRKEQNTTDIYPVLRAEVFTYRDRSEISVLLQNFWYRDQGKASISGPYYEAL